MRRVLRKVAAGEVTLGDLEDVEVVRARLGDLSTLADPGVIRALVMAVKEVRLRISMSCFVECLCSFVCLYVYVHVFVCVYYTLCVCLLILPKQAGLTK